MIWEYAAIGFCLSGVICLFLLMKTIARQSNELFDLILNFLTLLIYLEEKEEEEPTTKDPSLQE